MRRRLLAISFLLVALVSTASAQDADWPRVVAPGHVSFDLPDGMEVDSVAFVFTEAEGRDVYTLRDGYSTISAGSKDTDVPTSEDALRAANLVVDIHVGEPGAYAPLGSEFNFTEEELDQVDEHMRTQFLQQAEREGTMSEIDWRGTDLLQLGQAQAIRLRFSGRAGANDDEYIVNVYLIQNYDTVYYVTFSYLRAVADDWIQDLDAALRTFQFEKRG